MEHQEAKNGQIKPRKATVKSVHEVSWPGIADMISKGFHTQIFASDTQPVHHDDKDDEPKKDFFTGMMPLTNM